VSRARRAAAVADVVILVFDLSRPLESWDHELLDETRGKPRVLVVNKTDQERLWDISALVGDFHQQSWGRGTCGSRLQPARRRSWLKPASTTDRVAGGPRIPNPACPDEAARQRVGRSRESRIPAVPVFVSLKTGDGWGAFCAALLGALDAGEPLRDTPLVTNVRHQALLEQALAAVEQADTSASEEFLLADLAVARQAFEEITGKRTSEDVLHAIFSRFCIGK
jgi:tRNA U34 5-carboxymethylaminomethyl modifying GTPase MnmE/TrmE